MDPSPLDDAVLLDQASIADNLTGILASLEGYDQGSIKGVLYRKPQNGMGKYEWIEEVAPPFDFSSMFSDLKERFGGGDFQLRIFAGGRIRKNVDFSIVKEKTPLTVVPPKDGGDTMMLFQMMMQQSAEANRQSQAAADRQMQMMMAMSQNSTQMMVGMVSALAGNREKMTDFLPLLMREEKGGGMKEAMETLVAAKSLFAGSGDASPGFDADDLVGSVLKIGGPIVGAVGKAFAERRQAGEAQPAHAPADVHTSSPLMISAPATPAASSRFPILDLIRDDVLFMFGRLHDPERAAEVVFDTLDKHQVAEDDINALVAAFGISPDWLGELAAEGIDLRSNPDWAQQFLSALVALHADLGGNDEPGQRDEGGEADTGPDGPAGARRLSANGGAEPRG